VESSWQCAWIAAMHQAPKPTNATLLICLCLLPAAGKGGAMSSYKFSSVGSRFKKQLGDLMVALHTMEPHYIRCIKPNSFNRPMDFENMNVLHQVGRAGSHRAADALAL